MVDENSIFEMIAYGGNARAKAYEAAARARKGDFELAEKLLKEADEEMLKAHHVQTRLIHEEVQGKKHEVSVLLVHAQDHLMTAMAERSLIENMIDLFRRVRELEVEVSALKGCLGNEKIDS
ncbi:PTS lactose/cellobiose transporter subunit IIA [Thermosediminibacter oceani]|uniref:Phosphotransferase system PTS lactose/cellobiose-specific IIA subunit n=1 Tax=Thermosediminibacter oceani (strain ATCC BAA-1034 / DSM 16646 / JW/IW-1228P) TaxID=555079 RepID=D9S0V7_THEOJ|nr:PTS lactose/cellobiose transporter subunit IIA [Thermosediminibacter oceani]ADL07121.1 phosphotransferase system PTS lactose/cellobiose-specific IIA subunit [Thermosediminibacter oceani DSM 16646]